MKEAFKIVLVAVLFVFMAVGYAIFSPGPFLSELAYAGILLLFCSLQPAILKYYGGFPKRAVPITIGGFAFSMLLVFLHLLVAEGHMQGATFENVVRQALLWSLFGAILGILFSGCIYRMKRKLSEEEFQQRVVP